MVWTLAMEHKPPRKHRANVSLASTFQVGDRSLSKVIFDSEGLSVSPRRSVGRKTTCFVGPII